jgi:hypothetical protein
MFFADLHAAVVECLRARVKNGQLTERGLARMAGISQPHIHNVLKGTRTLSLDLSDQILYTLRLSILDLVDREVLLGHLQTAPGDPVEQAYLPVLRGKIGPGHPWPAEVDGHERICISRTVVDRMHEPVLARLAADSRMGGVFSEEDLALLDQSPRARSEITAGACYLIKRGNGGLVRRLRYLGRSLYVFSDDVADRPAGWERLRVEDHQLTYFVRAKVTLVARDADWARGVASPPLARATSF